MKKAADLPYATILAVNTTDRESVDLAWLANGQAPIAKSFPVRSQELPRLIEEFLAEIGQTVKTVRALAVMRTPGSLTGARMGIATVNTLAWLEGVPVIDLDEPDFTAALNNLSQGKIGRVGKKASPAG